ncbi:hypothetical protein L596_021179 [Steinernema carpocapsae]|uniref:Uncharacterized protein n=1 Tax=Steinernema carpocapsae TaxID=34508 RepID=A0A4U5MVQ8_STECR|nr:hypothetical protein L596_021179 [Steinernema carpocapsae]
MSFNVISHPSKDATAKMLDSIEQTLRKFQVKCEKAGLRNDDLVVEELPKVSVEHLKNPSHSSANKTFVTPSESQLWNPKDNTKRADASLLFFRSRDKAGQGRHYLDSSNTTSTVVEL